MHPTYNFTDLRRARQPRTRPSPLLAIAGFRANRLRTLTRAWSIIAAAILSVVVIGGANPNHSRQDVYIRIALLTIVVVGVLVSWFWTGAGASIFVAGALGIGALIALESDLWHAIVALAVFVPGALLWLAGQRSRPLRDTGLLAGVLVVGLLGAGVSARQTHGISFAAAQSESPVEVAPGTLVDWIWAGATTDTSVVIKAATLEDLPDAQLTISTSKNLADSRLIPPAEAPDTAAGGILTFEVEGLAPGTDYWYAVTANGTTDEARKGHFRTFPAGPSSFTFAFGACAETGSNSVVFDTIREANPLFFLSGGDFFYGDIAENDPALYRAAFDEVLQSPAQGTLYRSVPIAYTWDDHDFGPNNSDSTSPGREAAQTNYRQVVPHYPLADDAASGAIYQAFTVGRVRFILTDNYSERSPDDAPDGADKTMLGDEQKAWLKQELLDANGTYPVIVWMNSQPWIAPVIEDGDGWGLYETERREIADFIVDNDIQGLSMLSGDAHMLAIDDGSNNSFSSEGIASFPVFHAAALDRYGSTKGGPYSEGAYPGRGQFGLVTIRDEGGSSVEIIWSGRNHKGEEIVHHQFTLDAEPASASGENILVQIALNPAIIPAAGAFLNQRHRCSRTG